MADHWLRSPEPRWLLLRLLTVYLLLAVALWASDGALGPVAAPLLLASIGLLLWTLRQPLPGKPAIAELPLSAWLLLLGGEATLWLLGPVGQGLRPTAPLWPYPLTALLLLLLSLYGLKRRGGWGVALLLLAVYLAAGLLLLAQSPQPRIDVFVVQQEAAAGLWAGHDPYAMGFTNIYTSDETVRYWGSRLATLPHFPYPPLSLLFAALSYAALHDVRIGFLLLQLGTGGLLFGLARRRSPALACGLLGIYLLHPRGLFVVEQAWTEPLVGACYGLWATARLLVPAGRLPKAMLLRQGLVLGLLLSTKQYSVLLLPLCLVGRFAGSPALRQSVALAIGLAAALLVPFALWHPADFVADVFWAQLRQPFRPDALSLLAMLHFVTGWQLSGALALLGAAGGLRLVWARLPSGPAGLLLAVPVVYLGFFATAKQAFCNYYYLAGVLLLFAIAGQGPGPAD